MDLAGALAFLAVAVLLVGVFAENLHPALGKYRRLLMAVGAVILLVSIGSELVRGFMNGFSAGASRH